MNLDIDLYDMLEKATEEDILTIITMSIGYYVKKYNRSYETTLKLIKGGCKQLQEIEKNKGV